MCQRACERRTAKARRTRGSIARVEDPAAPARLAEAARARTSALVDALAAAGPEALARPSALPGWDRLTIACHLRYGASASLRMTVQALSGEPTAFYPGGRSTHRPRTLVPLPGEGPMDVVDSLGEESARLHEAWGLLSPTEWRTPVREPSDNPDLGVIPVSSLALLRLTEVEVHGSDLDLGLDEWSPVFVADALPMRLRWLTTRRSNHRPIDPAVQGSWLLSATDGPKALISAHGDQVTCEPPDPDAVPGATIEGTSRDLLALLLGRPPVTPLRLGGDVRLAGEFSAAFPGP